MDRIPFALIALADANSFVSNAIANADDAMTTYHALIEGCGWTIQDYETTLLSSIDVEWDNVIAESVNRVRS